MLDLLAEIRQALGHNKLRTALTGLSVSWGIFMLIVLLSMARGVTNSFEENMAGTSSARITIWGGMTSKPYNGNREGRSIDFKDKDMSTLQSEHPDFTASVSSEINGPTVMISSGRQSVQSSYSGVFPEYLRNMGFKKMTSGRNFSAHDLSSRAKVMILPQEYATQLFPDNPAGAVGERVSLEGLSFKVVGVYEGRWMRSIFIPFTTAQMMSKEKDDVGALTVNLRNVRTAEDGSRAEEGIRQTLAQTHNFDPADESAVWIANRFNNSLQSQTAMGILNTAVWILGMLTLLTGVVGISNIMFVSVRERTHEIGIRRAIGAKPRAILTQVIAESVAITVLFGYIGIVFGTAVSQLLAMVLSSVEFLKNPTVSLSIAVEVTVVLVIAGALAGLFPAMRALKVKPVEALRDE